MANLELLLLGIYHWISEMWTASYSLKIRTRFVMCNKLMHSFQLRFLIKMYIDNFMVLLLYISCFLDLAPHREMLGKCHM